MSKIYNYLKEKALNKKTQNKICFIQYESKIGLMYENSNNDKYLMMFQEMEIMTESLILFIHKVIQN